MVTKYTYSTSRIKIFYFYTKCWEIKEVLDVINLIMYIQARRFFNSRKQVFVKSFRLKKYN